MSQVVDREKVLQTTKVRTSIKSDLSWIQKMKKAEEQDSSTKESTVPAEKDMSPSPRHLSYVLMTAKKFELDTSSENGLQNGKHPEPVSPEPAAATTTTEEKNHVEPPKSNDSAEVSTKVEELIVNDTTSVDESVTCTVPDILVESVFKTPPPQENSNGVSKAKALDILSESLVEPILDVNPHSETAADQNVLDMLSDSLVKPILDFNPSSVEVPKEPEIPATENIVPRDNAEEAQLTSTKEGSVEVDVAQNDLEPVKASEETKIPDIDNTETEESHLHSTQDVSGPESLEIIASENNVDPVRTIEQAVEVPKQPEIPVIVTDVPQENSESNETQSTKEDVVETIDGEINVQNEAEPVKTSEEATVAPKEPDIPATVTDVPKDNVDLTATDIEQSGTTNAEVTEQKTADITVISSTDTEFKSVSLPNGDTSTNVDSTITQDSVADQGITEAVLSDTKEAIVDQKSSVQESKITEVVAQEDIAVPDNTNIVVDPAGTTQAEESTVSGVIESEQKQTAENPILCTETIAEPPEENAKDVNKVEVQASLETPEAENVETAVQPSPNLAEINQDEIFKAEPVVVLSPPESPASEVEESSPLKNIATEETSEVTLTETKIVPDNTNIAEEPAGTTQIDEEEKTPTEESPENSNIVETTVQTPNQSAGEIVETITNGSESESTAKDVEEKAVIPEKEIVTDVTPAEESTVSGVIESEQKQTAENPILCTETLAEPPEENAEDVNKVEIQASLETPEVAENVETAVQIEPKVESTPVVPSVASENQAALDISDALDVVTHSEQSKEDGGAFEITDALDEATTDKTVNGFEELEDSSGEKQPTDNISVPSSEEKEETSSFIMRDGKEVCSHCDQFIGLIKLTLSYPPKYLHPECLTCGVCTKVLGDLLTPMFEHNQLIYCYECYDKVYSLA